MKHQTIPIPKDVFIVMTMIVCSVLVAVCLPAGTAFAGSRSASDGSSSFGSADSTGSGRGGDPINLSVGEYYFDLPLLNTGGLIPVYFDLHYGHRMEQGFHGATRPFGSQDFTHNFHIALRVIDGGNITVFIAGNMIGFGKSPTDQSLWTSDLEESSYRIVEDDSHYHMADIRRRLVYTFEKRTVRSVEYGIWTGLEDRNGNTLTATNSDDDNYPLVTKVEDGYGRFLTFTYMNPTESWTFPHLSTVTDHAGNRISFTYDVDPNESKVVMTGITDALNNTYNLEYTESDTNLAVTKLIHPNGGAPYSQTFERVPDTEGVIGDWAHWRVSKQTNAVAEQWAFAYDTEAGSTTITDPGGNTRTQVHEDQMLLTSWIDQSGNAGQASYDAAGRRTSITDRLGRTYTMTYHDPTGRIASYTDPAGTTTSYTYTAREQGGVKSGKSFPAAFTFYDLTRIDLPDGSSKTYEYDAFGNVSRFIDRMGGAWTFTYNTGGRPLTITNPLGGKTTYTYNADATLASSTDSDLGTTGYAYDSAKRVTQVTYPDGSKKTFTYNAAGQVIGAEDANGNSAAVVYNSNGKPCTVTNMTGDTMTYDYDAVGRIASVTDEAGKTMTYAYQYGALASVTDPSGVTTTFTRDATGRTASIVRGTNTTTQIHDAEGVVTGRTSGLGNTYTFGADAMGKMVSMTDPLGKTTTLTRDELSRVTGITTPNGSVLTLTRDIGGRPIGVSRGGISAACAYNSLSLPTAVTDPNGSVWQAFYTTMGRTAGTMDPLNNTTDHTYNELGRRAQTTYPDGTTMTQEYDANGNIISKTFSDGLVLAYTYNAANLPTGANGVNLGYTKRSRVSTTTTDNSVFGATYDDAGRPAIATYADGAMTVSYTYDAVTGFLIGVEDNLGDGKVDFILDADGRITGINRGNGVDTTITFDAANRPIRILDGSTSGGTIIDIAFTRDSGGRITSADINVPLDPAGYAAAQADLNLTYDKASQVGSTGYAFDARGRCTQTPNNSMTWDSASRLVAVDGTTLTYNGFHDVLTRTNGGVTTTMYTNHAVSGRPVTAESVSGVFTRFYVFTPGGSLLYSVNASSGAVTYYHYDHLGSTLALTDAGGRVVDAYAYSPHGELLAQQGNSDQPFTFLGRWSVRREGDLYQIRRRYYDPTTGRFLTRDPGPFDLSNPSAINPYQYATADPINNLDVTGYDSTTASGVSQYLDNNGRLAPMDVEGAGFTPEQVAQVRLLEDKIAANDQFITSMEQINGRLESQIDDAERMVEYVGTLHNASTQIDNAASDTGLLVKLFAPPLAVFYSPFTQVLGWWNSGNRAEAEAIIEEQNELIADLEADRAWNNSGIRDAMQSREVALAEWQYYMTLAENNRADAEARRRNRDEGRNLIVSDFDFQTDGELMEPQLRAGCTTMGR